jgi:hypothetical protein
VGAFPIGANAVLQDSVFVLHSITLERYLKRTSAVLAAPKLLSLFERER